MSDTVEPGILFISSVVGGQTQENKPWRDAILDLYRATIELGRDRQSDINLAMEFHVPGHILSPDYVGVRTGSYRKRDSLLIVQVALEMPAGPRPDLRLIAALREAIEATHAWAKRRKMQFDSEALEELTDELETRLEPNG